ncbi:cob(I)yrinic acid a,c-diamide adenosyltransferase [Fervidobacterium sp.]
MSITTKTGDTGDTSLANGERISKAHVRVESYGTIDELNSFLGLAKHFLPDYEREIVEGVQKDLFRVAAELAKGEKYVRLINDEDVERLTKFVHSYEESMKLDSFVIPGETIPSAYLDVCRTIARRSERLVVRLSQQEEVRPEIVKYLNRLSDLLYIMARFVEGKHLTRIRGSEL